MAFLNSNIPEYRVEVFEGCLWQPIYSSLYEYRAREQYNAMLAQKPNGTIRLIHVMEYREKPPAKDK